MSLVDLLQTLFHDVRVNLRRGNVAVTEHQLDRAKIGASFQQMRCKTVTQHVRRKRHTQTRLSAVGGKNLPHTDAAQSAAAAVQEKSGRIRKRAFSKQLGTRVA